MQGVTHREKVGRRSDAVKLYAVRKADIHRGAKLPANMKNKGLKFEVIGKEAIAWYIEHGRKDVRSFRIRMNIILKDFGQRVADEIKTVQELAGHKTISMTVRYAHLAPEHNQAAIEKLDRVA